LTRGLPAGTIVADARVPFLVATIGDAVVDAVLDLHADTRTKSTLSDVGRYRTTDHPGPIIHQRGAQVAS
jgi:hypothetical protein